jgi:hypothetical protein
MGAIKSNRASTPALEKYYSPKELSQLMDLSTDTIRRMFLREPGVLIINDGAHGKRRYRTLRIPESVVQRVLRRLTLTRVI